MTDKSINDTRPTDETKEIRSRNSMFSKNKFKTNNKYLREQTRSPSLSALLYCEKDVGTPKPRSRRRFNCCPNGDSPSEADPLQDIIWDPASPPAMSKGKEAGESVVEISEIVNRIAPNEEKSVDEDSVLHWIGDSAIPCTPEVQQPRVRRCSARRQCNNVEDLMKLAKQFDLTMTRQHKDTLERLQNSKGLNCKDLHKLNKLTATHPEPESNGASVEEAKGLGHEEELHAMFDGPTQHLTGRLSPLSANCSQESRTEKTATHGMRPVTSDSKNPPEDAQVSKPDFDDDWENDDLLSDFVLEVSQNPQLLSSCMARPTSHISFAASKKCEPKTATSSSLASSRDGCLHAYQITSHYTRISSETYTKPSSFRSDGPVQSDAIMQLPKTTPDSVNTDSEYQTAHTVGGKQQIAVGPGAKYITSSAGASGKDPLWGDGDDDDLLYQACDDVERSAAIKEKQRDKNLTKASYSLPEVPSSIITVSSSMSRNSTTFQSQHPTEYRHPVCVFARSHSIPGASGNHVNKQGLSESASALQVNHYPENSKQQYPVTQLMHATGPSGENSYHSTFKRHQSDPGILKNKVFITSQPAVKCSATEIERKKQEAIARRRLRLQATLKPAAPT
ncbi:hypothetical protein KOW79_002702 [Hemibagrus wyckioides]|uniref:Ewing's tumor-associated antigen 1 n=1 Tax=Hemibagrus wyckioides TaxID=337641 RepID=A0A9D3STB0_9TELE|nr:ewing's tumor-associated antigen 1 isoform X2 [Hemibagrus wyckioides]KAG7334295.1 hypothetical protein KOW79_002702 [Hemibagrus wyckioides]